MPPRTDEWPFKPHLGAIYTLVFHHLVVFLLLTHQCEGETSSLIISLEKNDADEDISGAVLQCKSKGWYPKPEVLWLDGEGNLLSSGHSETIRGPDGLYTVSSRVTVEKKHSKSFTCRVQQKNINQTRETTIFVSDDFIILLSSSALTAGLAVILSLSILLILLLVFYIWRQNRGKTKETNKPEKGSEGEQRTSAETEKIFQVEIKQADAKQLNEDIQKNMNDLLKELERKKEEHEESRKAKSHSVGPSKEEKEEEGKTLKEKQETRGRELNAKVDEAIANDGVLKSLEEKLKENIKKLQKMLEELERSKKEMGTKEAQREETEAGN